MGHAGSGGLQQSRVPKHWLLDREDARTILVVSVLIFVVAVVGSVSVTGIPTTLLVVWVAASFAQLLHAIVRVAREQGTSRSAHSGEAEE